MPFEQDKIRNFSIIAHIDHGKSTIADRILEKTKAVDKRKILNQLLDNMELERERGITIKARAVTLVYKANDNTEYMFNLIDTPGHVDFNYEVSRSLAACEGAILVVDASQGVQAQTLANAYLAFDAGLEILPVINKIDLISADPSRVKKEIKDIIGIDANDAPLISAKLGTNIESVLERIIKDIPSPSGKANAPLKALVFDSYYDAYKGVIVYIRVIDGVIKTDDEIKFMSSGAYFVVTECGFAHAMYLENVGKICAGEVGYVAASIKFLSDARVGDTITSRNNPTSKPLPGYKKIKPMVFCGIYSVDGSDYDHLKDALAKLKLSDASLSYEPETSAALGFGFRCGFLGLLHMEITVQRLEREYDLDVIASAPSVVYKVKNIKNSEILLVDNPTIYPPSELIEWVEEPIVNAYIYSPSEYIGSVIELCVNKRGILKDINYIDQSRVKIYFEMPLSEIIYDFFDGLKSKTKGYASFDYEFYKYERTSLVKVDLMLSGDVIDALSFIICKDKAYNKSREICKKLKDKIPRQLFEVAIQACIGGKIIARETVKALRKDVISKCYGGDVTRKKKLLEKQKQGKKRMKKVGSIEIPGDAFLSCL
jgi:GTP-binding protein LepA